MAPESKRHVLHADVIKSAAMAQDHARHVQGKVINALTAQLYHVPSAAK
jgi:hypothetical protein